MQIFDLVKNPFIDKEHFTNVFNISTTLRDENGMTVAMHIAKQDYIPIYEAWGHDSSIVDKDGMTVAMHIVQSAKFGVPCKTIPEKWRHDPNLQNKKGMTVAMICAVRKIVPPGYFLKDYDSSLRNSDGLTYAMLCI